MSYKVNGKITKISEIRINKDGSKALDFFVESDEVIKNGFRTYLFNMYKNLDYADSVDKFVKYNKIGDLVTVEFNVNCREWEGKYFTNLTSWRVDKLDSLPKQEAVTAEAFAPDREDLPF
jgi:hypothetical protein